MAPWAKGACVHLFGKRKEARRPRRPRKVAYSESVPPVKSRIMLEIDHPTVLLRL